MLFLACAVLLLGLLGWDGLLDDGSGGEQPLLAYAVGLFLAAGQVGELGRVGAAAFAPPGG